MSLLNAPPTLLDPLPRDLAGWANPSGRKVRRSADAFLNRAIILTRFRKDWEAGTLSEEQRARLARSLVVYLRDEARIVAELFRDGQLSERQWRDRMAEITGAGAVAATFALQGHRRISRQDAEELAEAIDGQMHYLGRFVRQVERGDVPKDGRIVSRSLLYATSAWTAAQAAARSRAERTGFAEERNVLGPAEHCPGCLAEASKGWQPIGTLVPIGDRNCRVNCRCRYEFRRRRARQAGAAVVPPPPPLPPPPPPAVDPNWPPPSGSGADPDVLDARKAWAEARRAKLIADLDAADRLILAGGDRGDRDRIADELTRLNSWFGQVRDNPRLIPPGPIRDRIRLYLEGEGGAKVRAIAAIGENIDRLKAEKAAAEAEGQRLFQESFGSITPKRRREIKAAMAAASRREADLGRQIRDAIDRSRQEAHDTFTVPVAERARLDFRPASAAAWGLDPVPGDSGAAAAIVEGRGWLAQRVRAAGAGLTATEVGVIRPSDEQRAYATNRGDTVALSQDQLPEVAVHEFGHVLDYKLRTGFGDESAVSRSLEFVEARTAGEQPRKLADVFPGEGYRDYEVGREDEFARAFAGSYEPQRARIRAFYAGKDYGGDATEVLSMGVEELYANPVEFTRGDPEWAGFILGLLDGSLR